MILLGLDPGATTGWAMIKVEDSKITPLGFGHDKDTTMKGQLENIRQADRIICEDFLVDPRYARRGAFDQDRMIAPQVIGSIRTLCGIEDKPIHMQLASVKPVGYGFVGKKYIKGKKGMHKWDALAHAVYYAVKHLGALPVGVTVSSS